MNCKVCGKQVSRCRDGMCNTCYVQNKNKGKLNKRTAKPRKKLSDYTKEEIDLQLENAKLTRMTYQLMLKDAEKDRQRELARKNAKGK